MAQFGCTVGELKLELASQNSRPAPQSSSSSERKSSTCTCSSSASDDCNPHSLRRLGCGFHSPLEEAPQTRMDGRVCGRIRVAFWPICNRKSHVLALLARSSLAASSGGPPTLSPTGPLPAWRLCSAVLALGGLWTARRARKGAPSASLEGGKKVIEIELGRLFGASLAPQSAAQLETIVHAQNGEPEQRRRAITNGARGAPFVLCRAPLMISEKNQIGLIMLAVFLLWPPN